MEIKVKDLAKLLNVSPATVSLVLNNKPGISETTRARVRGAIHELGYGRLLTEEEKERKNILFVVYRKKGPAPMGTPYFSQIFSDIIEGVENQIKARGYNLMISYMDERSVLEEASKINRGNVEGVLLLGTDMGEEQIEVFEKINLPLVIIDNYMEQKQAVCITINNEMGVSQAIRYFKATGHNRVGYLHTNEEITNFRERYYGFLRSMDKFGLHFEKEDILTINTEGGEDSYRELIENLKEKELPDAFFADNDIVAITAMKVFREMGYRIPEDISIIGFDNMALSEMVDPPLTTVHVPKFKLGIAAANAIIDIHENLEGAIRIEIGTELVVRKSVRDRMEM